MFLYLIADPKSSEQGKSALFGELKKLKSTLLPEQDKPSTSVKPAETNTKTQAGELVEEHWSVSEVYHVFRSWTITISDTNCSWIYRIPLNLSHYLSQCLSSSTAPKIKRPHIISALMQSLTMYWALSSSWPCSPTNVFQSAQGCYTRQDGFQLVFQDVKKAWIYLQFHIGLETLTLPQYELVINIAWPSERSRVVYWE